MPVNISRHTCALSDLPWESASLGDDSQGVDVALPLFPKSLSSYLEKYATGYIAAIHIEAGCNVT
jgi:hypothetical protein